MSDEHLSLTPSTPPTEADYEAIATAVMETLRGRWFLAEYAKRNRNADTELILKGLDRIERLLHERPPAVSPAERVRIDLVEMAKAIAQTRSEIAAIKPDGDAKGTLSEATEELDSIVQTTERATSDILAAAEQVQEIAWTLRERGTDGDICDSLDRRATDIYSACSFQDLTGQRTRKVVDVLHFLEERIRTMIEIWGGAVPDMGTPTAAPAAPHVGEDRSVPHLEQREIDRMMPSARALTPSAGPSPNGHDASGYEHAADDRAFAAPAADDRGAAVDIAAGAPPGPAGGIPMAETAVAADSATTAETGIPTVTVGATALALELAPVEVAREPEPQPEPEPKPESKLEPQPEPELEPQPEPELQPEPEPEPQPEPTPEVDAQSEAARQPAVVVAESEQEAALSEPRADPAAVLKRILAIIRAPNEPSAELAAMEEPAPATAAAEPAESVAPSPPPAEIEPAQAAAAEAAPATVVPAESVPPLPMPVEIESAHAAAEPTPAPVMEHAVVAADVVGPEIAVADIAAVVGAPPENAAEAQESAEQPAPQAAIGDDVADEILMPLPGPVTVDQAVAQILRKPAPPAPPTAAEAVAIEPVAPPAPEYPAAADEQVAVETQAAAAVSSGPPFVLALPELTVAPSPEPAPEPACTAEAKPVAQTELFPQPLPAVEAAPLPAVEAPAVAFPEPPAIRQEAAPEPTSVAAPPPIAAVALAPTPAEEPAPVAAAAAPVAAPEPVRAPETPPPPAPPAAAPLPAATSAAPAAAPRDEALAAITALSDDEKIALFS